MECIKTVNYMQANDVAMGSASDDIYLAGYSRSNNAIDGISATGDYDILLMKYNSSGTRQWTKLLGVSVQSTFGYGLDLDSSGNIYATGSSTGNLDNNTNAGSIRCVFDQV